MAARSRARLAVLFAAPQGRRRRRTQPRAPGAGGLGANLSASASSSARRTWTICMSGRAAATWYTCTESCSSPAATVAQGEAFADVRLYMCQEDHLRCECGGRIRPDIVWFGEVPYHMERILAELQRCTVMLVVGTSGVVQPAANFVHWARLRDGAGCACAPTTWDRNIRPTPRLSPRCLRAGPANFCRSWLA